MSATLQDRPDVEVFAEIGVIEHHARMAVSRHLPEGMTYAHYEVLSHLVRHGDGQTPAELAQSVLMSKAAITNVLQKMAAHGRVCVLGDVDDKRKKRVRLTSKGLESYNWVLRTIRWKTLALREAFTEAEFRDALPFLRALRGFLQEVSETKDVPAAACQP
ncbi:MarR family winged helix-turn-helix transcriptional regulator [Phenylobacterium sp.]|uniref:MarR family winged helix-turn-helix transcriptional regulator n=1 Tax=Phenylobacterium sp. TaxID=1871053 RepID=UPI0035B3C2B6